MSTKRMSENELYTMSRTYADEHRVDEREAACAVAGKELSRLAQHYCAQHNIEFSRALELVVNDPENGHLKSAYAMVD